MPIVIVIQKAGEYTKELDNRWLRFNLVLPVFVETVLQKTWHALAPVRRWYTPPLDLVNHLHARRHLLNADGIEKIYARRHHGQYQLIVIRDHNSPDSSGLAQLMARHPQPRWHIRYQTAPAQIPRGFTLVYRRHDQDEQKLLPTNLLIAKPELQEHYFRNHHCHFDAHIPLTNLAPEHQADQDYLRPVSQYLAQIDAHDHTFPWVPVIVAPIVYSQVPPELSTITGQTIAPHQTVYQIIDGHRRCLAAAKAGLPEIPVFILTDDLNL
ncbi:ParB N-terminal domain-containing protein [bacterium]|nr:ParB N-terminal domain-containing protein [bacterium]